MKAGVSRNLYYRLLLYMQEEAINFGVDWEELPTQCEEVDVQLPVTMFPCSDDQMEILRGSYDPLDCCDDYGISTYIRVKNFIMRMTLES